MIESVSHHLNDWNGYSFEWAMGWPIYDEDDQIAHLDETREAYYVSWDFFSGGFKSWLLTKAPGVEQIRPPKTWVFV